MSESLSFHEKGTNSGEMNFLCSIFTRLAVLVVATFNDLFNVGTIKTLVVADLTILYSSMRY